METNTACLPTRYGSAASLVLATPDSRAGGVAWQAAQMTDCSGVGTILGQRVGVHDTMTRTRFRVISLPLGTHGSGAHGASSIVTRVR